MPKVKNQNNENNQNVMSQFDKLVNTFKNLFKGKSQRQQFQYTQERKNINDVLQTKLQSTFPFQSTISHRNRIEEYKDYYYIYRYIPEQAKQLRQLISYILKPDSLTEETFKINVSNVSQYEIIEQLLDYLEIEDMMYNILFDMLLFGNCYVRIYYQDIEDSFDLQKLQEMYKIQIKNGIQIDTLIEKSQKIQKKQQNTVKQKLIESKVYFNEIEQQTKDNIIISVPIKLELIHPENIINLEEFGIYGYIYIPTKVLEKWLRTSIQGLESIFTSSYKVSIESILQSIQEEIKNKFGKHQLSQIIIKIDDDEILYLPYDEVVDFKNQVRQNQCYGQSIFEHIKLLQIEILLVELSMIVYKLNRSPDRRVFRIPIDDVNPAEVQNYIETLKQKLKNDVSIDLDGRIDQIPRFLSVLDDYWIPVKNGEGLFEIQILEGGNIQHFKDELDYLRNKLVTTLGVPPEILGIGQTKQATRILQEDEQFQREIVQYQRFVEIQLDNMFFFILNRMNQLEYYEKQPVKLAKPEFFTKLLYYEIQKQKLEYQAQLQQFNIPNTYILKNILDLSDDEIQEIEQMREKEQQKQQQQQQQEQQSSELGG